MSQDKVSTHDSPSVNPASAYSTFPVTDWNQRPDNAIQAKAIADLEHGNVLLFPNLPFVLTEDEQAYLRPDCVEPETKSIKFSLSRQRLWGVAKKEKNLLILEAMMRRYTESARHLVNGLFPHYTAHLKVGNTSYRPVEAQGRVQSKRHDDRLLHVDAFPSRPTQGERLLRVFSNVHPGSNARIWQVGEPFINVAMRFLPQIPIPSPAVATLLRFMKITKSTRTPYDHYMLHLHDKMKLDASYQAEVPKTTIAFPPGSSWIVFSDQVSHAAISGQYAFEQTFMLPVWAQADPATSPLQVLEKLKGRKLG